jgi:hypothetical protein
MAKIVTEKMFSYATYLITTAVADATTRRDLLLGLPALDGNSVSQVIDLYKPLVAAKKSAAKLPDFIPPKGVYMIEGKSYKLKISQKTGAPYLVTMDNVYIGTPAKVSGACEVFATAESAHAAAVAYGKATGNCGVCGKVLTNPASIEAGIGPVCASKYGY